MPTPYAKCSGCFRERPWTRLDLVPQYENGKLTDAVWMCSHGCKTEYSRWEKWKLDRRIKRRRKKILRNLNQVG